MLLEEIVKDWNPTVMYNGQVRITCPFRENHTAVGTPGGGEKTMFLTPDINSYHCFGCKEKGQLVRFLNKKFAVPIGEAMKLVTLFNLHREEKEKVWEVEKPFSKEVPQRAH